MARTRRNGGGIVSKNPRVKNRKHHVLHHAKRDLKHGTVMLNPSALKNLYTQKFQINNILSSLMERTNTRINRRSSTGSTKTKKPHPLMVSAKLARKYAKYAKPAKPNTITVRISPTRRSARGTIARNTYNPKDQEILDQIKVLSMREARERDAAKKEAIRKEIHDLSDLLGML